MPIMPIAARCPSCGAPLSEVSVLAVAPVCEHCGVVITKTGGTLGLTSAYGVNDPTITRARVEADLAVFRDYRNNCVGMLEACKEQLHWGLERYAKFPYPPEFLPVEPVPPFFSNFMAGLGLGVVTSICVLIVGGILIIAALFVSMFFYKGKGDPPWLNILGPVYGVLVLSAWTVPLTIRLLPYFKAKSANGKRPLENERRQAAYEAACATAMRAAEPVKAAQDHRLRCDIRKLEGLITTFSEKAEDVRRILRTL